MNQQVADFAETVIQMRRFYRGDANALNSYLSKCIFYSGMGSNDYLNNYFMTDFYSSHSAYTPKAFAGLLLNDYTRQLTVSLCLSALENFPPQEKTSTNLRRLIIIGFCN